MQIITKYSQIAIAPTDMQPHLYDEFAILHGLYNDNDVELNDYELGEIGQFVLIQNTEGLHDLSRLNFNSNIITQSLEFVLKYTVNKTIFYDVCVLHDTDCATRFIIDNTVLDDSIRSLLEGSL